VDVRVDQARQQRAISQIDHFGSRRMLHRGSRFDNALALHQNFAGLQDASGLDVEQPRGAQHDGLRWRILGFGGGQEGEQQK